MAGAPGALPSRAHVAGIARDALDTILRFDHQRTGECWRALVRPVMTVDFRPRRYWWAVAAGAPRQEIHEGGAGRRHGVGSSGGWLQADLQVKHRYDGAVEVISYERAVDVGPGIEIATWASAQMALWNDKLDLEVATLVTDSATVAAIQGAFDSAHFVAAIQALNRQTIAGAVLGSGMPRPVVVAGEGRRDEVIRGAGLPGAEGDRTAITSRAVISATLPDEFCCVVHARWSPVVVAALTPELAPELAVGKWAGAARAGGKAGEITSDGAAVFQSRSAAGLVTNQAKNAAPGLVRLVT